MADISEEYKFELSVEERRVLKHWQNGDNMTEAYKKVMLSPYDLQAISDSALKKRVVRFFNTYRMREAMAQTPGPRGVKAREDFEQWRTQQKKDYQRRIKPPRAHTIEIAPPIDEEISEDQKNKTFDEIHEENVKSSRDKWLESLNVNENPSAMTIYGTGQFLAYMAVKEIMARQAEIRNRGVSVLDKEGSVFTPTIISALKTAASMVLPFAPAPTAEDRKEMSKAAVLLGLFPDNITESPDDYTAEPPSAIDVNE